VNPGKAASRLTHNPKDFRGADVLGVKAVTPADFLALLDAAPDVPPVSGDERQSFTG